VELKDFKMAVAKASREAFELAQKAIESGHMIEFADQARAINQRLDELLPGVQAAPAEDQPTLNHNWSDARLDVGYVLSNGQLPSSTRLYYYLEDRKKLSAG
jgi:hypothetical protein